MSSKTPAIPFKQILFATILLLCCAALFFIYYKPTMSWSYCSGAALLNVDPCTEACQSVHDVENLPQILKNCIINHTVVQEEIPPTQSKHLEQETTGEDHGEIIVLVWKWPFGETFDLKGCESTYGIKGCTLTLDRNLMDRAHSVMFHVRDIGGDLPYLMSLSRPSMQKWVWMNMESPSHTPELSGADDLFNLTSNYRRDADVWVPYGQLIEASEEEINSSNLPEKDKLVCWIVSNWNNNHRRVSYFNELSKHITVETYGRHFGRYIEHGDYSKLMSRCKFYLSFENSIHRDYITEKVFNPMSLGTVPVVLGPPRENYEAYLPSDSFIHVDDFESPQKLAEHLKLLDQNQELYERYFTWRKDYVVRSSGFGLEHACHICEHVRNKRNFRVFKNVNKWYWS